MTRTQRIEIFAVLLLAAQIPRTVAAQHSPRASSHDVPSTEVGVDVGAFNLMGWGLTGGHLTRNYTSWLAGEVAVHGQSHSSEHDSTVPDYLVSVVEARLQCPANDRDGFWFLTVGAARAFGLNYRHSPMIGVGYQINSRPRLLAFRIDFQKFPRGEDLKGRDRLMAGLTLLL